MDKSRVVVGQRELEVIYSATRDVSKPAEHHEQMKTLAQTVLVILEKAALNGEVPEMSKKSDGEKGEDNA